jgi:CRP/FNR family transcriptional regulator, cyclic AMP receptor protein
MTQEFERPAFRAELKRQALFAGFSDEDLDEILAGGLVRRLKPKHVLFLEGDNGDAAFIVIEGRVKVSVNSLDGREIILSVSGPGDLFGEIAMLDGGPRTAAAMTLEEVRLLQLERDAVMPVLERNPGAMLRILRLLCARLRTTNQMMEEILFHSGASRLAAAILRLLEAHGVPEDSAWRLPLRLPQSAFGAHSGLQRESVARQMRAWESAGVLLTDEVGLLVLKREELERIAAHDGAKSLAAGRERRIAEAAHARGAPAAL